jgi:hypothetical protein
MKNCFQAFAFKRNVYVRYVAEAPAGAVAAATTGPGL